MENEGNSSMPLGRWGAESMDGQGPPGVLAFAVAIAYRRINGESMNSDRLNRITIEAGKCGGRPCIRGQRIRVTDVLELLGAGASYEEILRDYPFLEREDILAALEYAAHQTDHVVLRTP